jgi:hypothetical protein
VLSTAELTALPRRSECAASGVAQLQGRRGDHHIQGDPPDAGSARNAGPDYKHQYEGGRRKKDGDFISQAKHRACEYGDNCDYEQQPRPRVRVLLFIFEYPCVFCEIDTSSTLARTICDADAIVADPGRQSGRHTHPVFCGSFPPDLDLEITLGNSRVFSALCCFRRLISFG